MSVWECPEWLPTPSRSHFLWVAKDSSRRYHYPMPTHVETDLSVFGADRPLILTMDWDGQQASASGTFPADFIPRGPQGTSIINEGEAMFLPDADGAFTANANAGVAALGFLQTGILTATATEIALAGTATSPQVGEAIEAVLVNVAPGTEISQDLTFLDDGSPAAWQVACRLLRPSRRCHRRSGGRGSI